jgi:hypothetical protein
MLNEFQILSIVKPIGKKLINFDINELMDLSYKKDFNIDKYYKRIPALNPVYIPAIRHRNEVAVHAIKGTFGWELLRSKSPNQSDAEWDYQKGLAQSYTHPTWGRAENKTKIVGNEQNFNITGWNEEQKKYFYTDYPVYHSLPAYFFDVVRKHKANFPNQVMLLRPEYIPYRETEAGFVVDQTETIPYIVDIVDEFRTASYREGKHLAVICDERIEVEGVKLAQFDFYDNTNIYKVIPTGVNKDGEVDYSVNLILEHGWGYLPAQKLKGEIQETKGVDVLYHSIFSFAIPKLNDAYRLSSNLSMSENYAAFPTRIRVVDKCSYTNDKNTPCINGRLFTSGKYETCPQCNGTGTDASITPTGEIQVKMYSTQAGGKETVLPMTPPMTYVAPDVAIYTHLVSRIRNLELEAFGRMFEAEDVNNPTATGRQLDNEEWYSTALQFRAELFNLMKFAIEGLGFFMFTKSKDKVETEGAFVMPAISTSQSLDFRDSAQITNEIAEARKNNMPEPYLLKLLKQYGATRFNSEEQVDKFVNFWVYCDRLWSKDDATIRTKINSTCTIEESIVHDSIMSFISQCEMDDEKFWDESNTDEIRKEKVFEKAAEIAALLKPEETRGADAMTEEDDPEEGESGEPVKKPVENSKEEEAVEEPE